MSTFTQRPATWADIRPGAVCKSLRTGAEYKIESVEGDFAFGNGYRLIDVFCRENVENNDITLIRPAPYVMTPEDVELLQRMLRFTDPHQVMSGTEAKSLAALIARIKESMP